ncbi:hypothetical protein E4T56_gene9301, partial [Termitomyces sp. T112]
WQGSITLDKGTWKAEVYGTNLANKFSVAGQSGKNELYGAPREYGVIRPAGNKAGVLFRAPEGAQQRHQFITQMFGHRLIDARLLRLKFNHDLFHQLLPGPAQVQALDTPLPLGADDQFAGDETADDRVEIGPLNRKHPPAFGL